MSKMTKNEDTGFSQCSFPHMMFIEGSEPQVSEPEFLAWPGELGGGDFMSCYFLHHVFICLMCGRATTRSWKAERSVLSSFHVVLGIPLRSPGLGKVPYLCWEAVGPFNLTVRRKITYNFSTIMEGFFLLFWQVCGQI